MWWWSLYRWSCLLLLYNEGMVPSVLSGVDNKCWVELRSYFTSSALYLIFTSRAIERIKTMERNAKHRGKEECLCNIMWNSSLCVYRRNCRGRIYSRHTFQPYQCILYCGVCCAHCMAAMPTQMVTRKLLLLATIFIPVCIHHFEETF